MASPGVQGREIDRSVYMSMGSATSVAIVGTAIKGPVGERTRITSMNNLIDTFGAPAVGSFGMLAAVEYLRQGNSLWYHRVASDAAAAATATIKDGDDADLIKVDASSPGTWANGQIEVEVANVDAVAGTFNLSVNYAGQNVESYRGLSLNEENPQYFESVINQASSYIRVSNEAGEIAGLTAGKHTLVGGDNGTTGLLASDYVKGVEDFSDPESVIVDIIAAPGQSDPTVVAALLNVAETRGDALALIDPPMGLTPSQVVDWHNGEGSYEGQHSAFNSSYGALFYGWQQINDSYNNRNVWVPPSVLVAAQIAYSDQVGELWYAPAGIRRGRLTRSIKTEYAPNKGDRDSMYGEGNAVNPIVSFAQEGILIYGQRTLQRHESATDRINVRRLTNFIKRTILNASRNFQFEQNDEFTWEEWKDTVRPGLEDIKSRRGIEDYILVMDETTTTPGHRQRNEMVGHVGFIPIGSAETIMIDFVVNRAGTSLSE